MNGQPPIRRMLWSISIAVALFLMVGVMVWQMQAIYQNRQKSIAALRDRYDRRIRALEGKIQTLEHSNQALRAEQESLMKSLGAKGGTNPPPASLSKP